MKTIITILIVIGLTAGVALAAANDFVYDTADPTKKGTERFRPLGMTIDSENQYITIWGKLLDEDGTETGRVKPFILNSTTYDSFLNYSIKAGDQGRTLKNLLLFLTGTAYGMETPSKPGSVE